MAQRVALNEISNSRPPSYDLPKLLPSASVETNKRLQAIEEQFDKLTTVMIKSVDISTALQAQTKEISEVVDFAVKQSVQSGKTAFRLSLVAIFISTLLPIFQFAYDSQWKEPRQSEETRQFFEELKFTILKIAETQTSASYRIVYAIKKPNIGPGPSLNSADPKPIQRSGGPR